MPYTTIVALFDSLPEMDAVRRDLQAAGIAATDINVAAEPTSLDYDRTTPREEPGFFEWLFGTDVSDRDRDMYTSGVREGGTLVSVRTHDALVDRATEILERYDPVDIDERAGDYAGNGLAGSAAPPSDTTGYGSTGAAEAGYAGTARDTDEAHIPVVEEEVHVGKRQVQGGRVRVRSYLVTTPVEEPVTLRDERVHVERRPATETTAVGEDAFRERSFEMTERSEQALVSKTARVREEVVVRKDATERAETIREDVRRTEVEIEREPDPGERGTGRIADAERDSDKTVRKPGLRR